MSEIQLIDTFPIWKAFLWCFYPIAVLVLVELVSSVLNDDDDDLGGGKMIPVYQTSVKD